MHAWQWHARLRQQGRRGRDLDRADGQQAGAAGAAGWRRWAGLGRCSRLGRLGRRVAGAGGGARRRVAKDGVAGVGEPLLEPFPFVRWAEP